MRQTNYIFIALGCGLFAVPVACGSNSSGVEDGSGHTGGSPFQMSGGAGGEGNVYISDTSTGSTISTGGSSTESTGCAQDNVSIQALPPDIMIVLDRSMSMTDDVNGDICAGGNTGGDGKCGTEAKWYKTIVAIDAVVEATQSSVNWGLFWLGNEPAQCGSSTNPAVPITPGASYDPIMQAIVGNQFTGAIGTPTAAVIRNAYNYLATVQDPNPKFLLLATDGEPNCADGRNIGNADGQGTANVIATALQAGVPTFVVGIATTDVPAATASLDLAANAGGYPQQGAATSYYAVSDTETLKTVLNSIIGIATSCQISLKNIPVNETWSIAISATDTAGNHVLIPNDRDNGWAYTDDSKTSITLVGTVCEGLKNGAFTDFKFVYTCADKPIVIT